LKDVYTAHLIDDRTARELVDQRVRIGVVAELERPQTLRYSFLVAIEEHRGLGHSFFAEDARDRARLGRVAVIVEREDRHRARRTVEPSVDRGHGVGIAQVPVAAQAGVAEERFVDTAHPRRHRR
jgi:hypothetical protein